MIFLIVSAGSRPSVRCSARDCEWHHARSQRAHSQQARRHAHQRRLVLRRGDEDHGGQACGARWRQSAAGEAAHARCDVRWACSTTRLQQAAHAKPRRGTARARAAGRQQPVARRRALDLRRRGRAHKKQRPTAVSPSAWRLWHRQQQRACSCDDRSGSASVSTFTMRTVSPSSSATWSSSRERAACAKRQTGARPPKARQRAFSSSVASSTHGPHQLRAEEARAAASVGVQARSGHAQKARLAKKSMMSGLSRFAMATSSCSAFSFSTSPAATRTARRCCRRGAAACRSGAAARRGAAPRAAGAARRDTLTSVADMASKACVRRGVSGAAACKSESACTGFEKEGLPQTRCAERRGRASGGAKKSGGAAAAALLGRCTWRSAGGRAGASAFAPKRAGGASCGAVQSSSRCAAHLGKPPWRPRPMLRPQRPRALRTRWRRQSAAATGLRRVTQTQAARSAWRF
jgi:hypothetical protein